MNDVGSIEKNKSHHRDETLPRVRAVSRPNPDAAAGVDARTRPRLRTRAAAAYIDCSEQTLHQRWREWGLHPTRLGRSYTFAVEELDELLRRKSQ